MGTFLLSLLTLTGLLQISPFGLAPVLQSNMVVQQGKPFRLWGTAPAGDAVEIRADWAKETALAHANDNGQWIVQIPVPEAVPGNFDPHTISIVHEEDTLRLENVLIGEVWMCSGQSNMTFMLDSIAGWGPGVPGHEKEVAAADYPYIRLIGIGMALEDQPVNSTQGDWKVCSPETVGSFSAVAYYFGRELFKTLKVPVGLVSNGIPGAGCQAFTNRKVMEADTALERKYLQPYEHKPRDDKEHILATLQRPSLIYNGMIYPIRHLSLRGFIWYQGESNRKDGALYTRLCTGMLQGWRNDFNQGDLPFYFVQMPPYNWGEDADATSYALFREAQEDMLEVKNTDMVVTMDVGEPDDLHPRNKKPVGQRLARLALNHTYGIRGIKFRGPEFSEFKTDQDTIKLSFTASSTGTGLSTRDGRSPDCFYLAGADKVFHQADAGIVNDQVWLHSGEVPKPLAVRYAFTNAAVTNFSNKEGLPAVPFRTDRWDDAVMVTGNVPAFRPATVLQSNMVVQQGKPFRLWGTAPAGDTVKVHASWSGETIALPADKQGDWSGQMPVPEAEPGNFDPHTVTMIHQKDTLELTNILIGEVWLCAGQSNMDMTVGKMEGWYPGVLNYEQEVADAGYPAIRLFKTAADFKLEPQSGCKGTWQVCSPETVGSFSAVAYFFGRKIFRELNIPVGLVASAFPGASCQAFTPRDVLEADPELKKKYLDPYEAEMASQHQVDTIHGFRKVILPVLIYNAMIHPLEKLSLRGFLWYQGESNHTEREEYTRLCTDMIQSWRERFDQGDLPFYFTQIAPYKVATDTTGRVSAFFREAQEALLNIKNTGMAVTMDVGEADNVHPRDKKSVGVRLARVALHQTYGFRDLAYRGPAFSAFETDRDTVKLSFVPASTGSGLRTGDKQPPAHFYLAGSDRVFHKAAARIVGDQVWVTSKEVPVPVAVRYAFTNDAITNLENKEGLPAAPFRTDQWEK